MCGKRSRRPGKAALEIAQLALVLAFIAAYPAGSGPDSYPNVIPTVSVWAADKH